MLTTVINIQLAVALTILNVWIFRRNRATNYRGAAAKSLREEFRAYGFPEWMYYIIGPLKVLVAILMIAAIWKPVLLFPSTLCMACMMLAALICHLRMRQDSLSKALPAGTILLLCSVILTISFINWTCSLFANGRHIVETLYDKRLVNRFNSCVIDLIELYTTIPST